MSELLGAVRRRRVLVLAGGVGGLVLGLVIVLLGANSYEAKATLLLTEPAGGEGAPLDSLQNLNLLAFTYAEIVESDAFIASATGGDPTDISVAAVVLKNTPVIEVAVTAPTPDEATEAASEMIDALVSGSVDVLDGSIASVDVVAVDLGEGRSASANGAFVLMATVIAGLVIAGMFSLLLEPR